MAVHCDQAQSLWRRGWTVGLRSLPSAPVWQRAPPTAPMFILHCTAKLRDRLKQQLQIVRSPTTTRLGDWYATALFWKPQVALLVNERTLLPVILPLAPADSLLERIGPAVAQVLARHGVDAQLIEAEATAMAQIAIAKTANRSVVGTMNEFAFEAKVYRDHGGTTDLIELSMRLAETPCGAIKYDSPSRLLRTIMAGSSH